MKRKVNITICFTFEVDDDAATLDDVVESVQGGLLALRDTGVAIATTEPNLAEIAIEDFLIADSAETEA